ncbi:UbiA prenyltransferase family [Thermoascus aurantiacus ATCC 26904]
MSQPSKKNDGLLPALLAHIQREYVITWRLLESNKKATFGCFLMGLFARLFATPLSSTTFMRLLLNSLIAAFIYAYTFDIANQATSVSEDAVSKPRRPIVAGLMGMDQAYRRWWISWALGPMAIYALFGKWAALHLVLWEAWTTFCYVWPKINHWFFRNAFSAVGIISLLRLLNAVVCDFAPEWDMDVKPDLAVSLWLMFTVHVQEFHDVDGDRTSSRRTLPLVLTPAGVKKLRMATACFLVSHGSLILLWTWNYCSDPQHCGSMPFFTGLAHFAVASVMAFRTIRSTSKEMDEVTYFNHYHAAAFTLFIHLTQLFFR